MSKPRTKHVSNAEKEILLQLIRPKLGIKESDDVVALRYIFI